MYFNDKLMNYGEKSKIPQKICLNYIKFCEFKHFFYEIGLY